MEEETGFDSVQWQREEASSDNTSQPRLDTDLPIHSGNQQRDGSTSNEPQAGANADAVDLAGIGEGVLECTVDAPQKENDGTPNAYVSYLISTHVRRATQPYVALLIYYYSQTSRPFKDQISQFEDDSQILYF